MRQRRRFLQTVAASALLLPASAFGSFFRKTKRKSKTAARVTKRETAEAADVTKRKTVAGAKFVGRNVKRGVDKVTP